MREEDEIVFSVIMPVYNREKVVVSAVESVLAQNFTNFELIIVDDCSTDHTVSRIRAINDPRLNLMIAEKNGGAAAARNIGIRAAKGNYISFLDSDDSFDPEYLAEAFKLLKTSSDDLGFVWCGTRYHELNENGTVRIHERIWIPKLEGTPYQTFLKSLHIGIGCGVTIKKEVFDNIGYFNEQLPAAEDTDFFLRIARSYSYAVINKVLVNIYKTGTDRMSTGFNKLSKAYEIFMPMHFSAIDKDRQLRLKYYYKLCWLNYYDNRKQAARRYLKKVLKDSPFHTKTWMVGFLFEVLGEKKAAKIHQKLSKAL